MMLLNNGKRENWNTSDDEEEEDENTPRKLNTSNGGTRYSDLESSGVFVAGYTGPIHEWEHPGYQFLTESAQGMFYFKYFNSLVHIRKKYKNFIVFKFRKMLKNIIL